MQHILNRTLIVAPHRFVGLRDQAIIILSCQPITYITFELKTLGRRPRQTQRLGIIIIKDVLSMGGADSVVGFDLHFPELSAYNDEKLLLGKLGALSAFNGHVTLTNKHRICQG